MWAYCCEDDETYVAVPFPRFKLIRKRPENHTKSKYEVYLEAEERSKCPKSAILFLSKAMKKAFSRRDWPRGGMHQAALILNHEPTGELNNLQSNQGDCD